MVLHHRKIDYDKGTWHFCNLEGNIDFAWNDPVSSDSEY